LVCSVNKTWVCIRQQNIQFTGGGNGPYYSLISNTEYSPLYILGILYHPVFEAMVKAGASEFQGAYYSHGKQFIENIPIRKIDLRIIVRERNMMKLQKTVQQLIDTKVAYRNVYIGLKRTSSKEN
jgi:hypothetical protein